MMLEDKDGSKWNIRFEEGGFIISDNCPFCFKTTPLNNGRPKGLCQDCYEEVLKACETKIQAKLLE